MNLIDEIVCLKDDYVEMLCSLSMTERSSLHLRRFSLQFHIRYNL
jgi:hypothetical protein